MASKNEIAEASVGINADISGLKEGVQEAKTEVETLGNEGEAAGSKTEGAMRGAADGTEDLAASLGKAAGIAGALVAAVSSVAKAYEAISDYVKSGETIADLFLVNQDSVNSTQQVLDNINKKIQEVGSELAKKEEGGLSSLAGRLKSQIEQELEALRDSQLSISRQLKQQREAALKEELENAKQTVKSQIDILNEEFEIGILPDEDQINIRAVAARKALTKAAIDAGIEYGDANLKLALENISKEAQARIDKNKEVVRLKHEDELKRTEELANKQAKAFADAMKRELSGIADSLFGSTSDFTTRLDTIVSDLKELINVTGRR
jgi:CxxC motif-containing protein